MKFKVVTIFPEIFDSFLKASIIGRAVESGVISVDLINFRDYATDKHHKVDDYPFGGGAGMVIKVEPLFNCLKSISTEESKIIYLTPKGKTLKQEYVVSMSKEQEIILVCGHYEDFDARIFELMPGTNLSIGDYILTGGEVPAMVIIESTTRIIEHCISQESLDEESFNSSILEYDQFTRPRSIDGLDVPDVLINGHKKMIQKWRRLNSIFNTMLHRPELLDNSDFTKAEYEIIKKFLKE